MDALELLADWPGIRELGPAEILAHPAWRMTVDFGEDAAVLTKDGEIGDASRVLRLSVTLDDAPAVLDLADGESLGDLHLLWDRLDALPEPLLVALAEKEAGALLQVIENVLRKELKIAGAAVGCGCGGRPAFRLETDGCAYGFALRLADDDVALLGVLDNLDADHGSIRELTRSACAEYAALELPDSDLAALRPGDFLLDDGPGDATWRTALPDDGLLRIRSTDETDFSFARFADDDLPPVPPPGALCVFLRGVRIASAEVARLGDATGYRIREISE